MTDERVIQGQPHQDWTPSEVDAAVQAYFAMWSDWLLGRTVTKSATVAALETILPARNRASIEYKFRNISSVTAEHLDVYFEGYQPLAHIQNDLRRAVSTYLNRNQRVLELLEAHRKNSLPASVPVGTATEDLLVPSPSGGRSIRERGGLTAGRITAVEDFRLRQLGKGGEELVLAIERVSLDRAGRADLAKRVVWASVEFGDGLGYDIDSFRPDGSPHHIEVKTTNFGIRTPFFITRNEMDVSADQSEIYSLYRVFDFRHQPRLYRLDGSVELTAEVDPYIYVGTPR